MKNKIISDYNIIFHINDIYSIKNLSKINSKDQLLFQKYSNKIQQLNLVVVDSIFPRILADVALESLVSGVSTFNQYIHLNVRNKRDDFYLSYKFKNYIYYLLFSDIDLRKIFKGEIDSSRIYYLKNNFEVLEYYSVFRQHELQELLLEKMIVMVDKKKSILLNDNVQLCLKLIIQP